MKVQAVKIDGFRGQSIEVVPDGKSVLIEGANGSGKSTVLEAIGYAASGNIPGKRIPDNDALTAMCGPDGMFDIILSDDENGQVRRSFTGTKTIIRANFGEKATSAINDDHTRAIEYRYGNVVSPLLLDAKKIVDMSPKDLRNVVLRLCYEASPESRWTYKMVVDYLTDKVARLVSENVVPDDRGESDFDALAFMDMLARIFGDQLTECRKSVRELNLILNAEAPIERPNPDEVAKLKKEVDKQEVELAELQRGHGALLERKRQIVEGNEAAQSKYRYSEQYLVKAKSVMDGAASTVSKYEAALESARIRVTTLTERDPKKAVPGSDADLFSKSDNQVLEPVFPTEAKNKLTQVKEEYQVTSAEYDAQRESVSDGRGAWGIQTDRVLYFQDRIDSLDGGICPTCGQNSSAVIDDAQSKILVFQKEADAIEDEVKKRIQKLDQIGAEKVRLSNAIDEYIDALQDYDTKHKAWSDQMSIAEADKENKIKEWESAYRMAQTEVATLSNTLDNFKETSVEAIKAYRAADKARSHSDAVELHAVPESLQESLESSTVQIKDGEYYLDAVRESLDAKTGAIKALAEFNRRQSEAEEEKQVIQNRQKIITDAVNLLPDLLNMIVSQMVGPLVGQVNAFMPPHMGKLSILFAPQFNVGLIRDSVSQKGSTVEGHFTPLRSLSSAEACIGLTLIQRAFIALSGSPFPVVLIDNVEIMDDVNWSVFKSFVVLNSDSMQVIAAGRRTSIDITEGLSVTPIG